MAAGESLAAWVVAGPDGGWEAGQAVRCEAGGQGYMLQGTASLVQDAAAGGFFLVTAASDGRRDPVPGAGGHARRCTSSA